jgi:hypothetical protein
MKTRLLVAGTTLLVVAVALPAMAAHSSSTTPAAVQRLHVDAAARTKTFEMLGGVDRFAADPEIATALKRGHVFYGGKGGKVKVTQRGWRKRLTVEVMGPLSGGGPTGKWIFTRSRHGWRVTASQGYELSSVYEGDLYEVMMNNGQLVRR